MKGWLCAQAVAALLFVANAASAQIEIHPLPDAAPIVPIPLGGHPLTPADLDHWLAGRLARLQRPGAGAVVTVVAGGQVLASQGHGRGANGAPVDPAATSFALGDAGTVFTWIAAMQQVATGHLALDAAVVPARAGEPRQLPPVTLRTLMIHTAGFAPVVGDCAGATPDRMPVRDPALAGVPAYSPCDAVLVAALVAQASGEPFTPYLERAVLRPLGVRSVAGDMVATGASMARTLQLLLEPGRVENAAILAPDTTRAWLAQQQALAPGLPPLALGLRRVDHNGWPVLAAMGDAQAPRAVLAVLPESGVGVFIAVAGTADPRLPRALLDAFLDRYFPPRPAVAQPALASARADGARLVGRYASSRAPKSGLLAAGQLFTQASIALAPSGELVTRGFSGADQVPQHWREVLPLGWQQVGGRDRLGAVLDHGQVRWVAASATAPLAVWLPVPRAQSAAWRLPWLVVALLVLLAGLLAWPVQAIARRRQGSPAVAASAWERGSRAALVAPLACAAGWAWVLWRALASARSAGAGPVAAGWLVQALGVAAIAGLVPLAVMAWRARSGRRIARCVLWLAAASFVWFVLDYRMLA